MGTAFQGYFSDGLSADRHSIRIRIEPRHLVIVGADGLAVSIWSFADLRPVDSVPGDALRLSCAASPDARLTLTDAPTVAALLNLVPVLRPVSLSGRRGLWGWAVASAIAVGVLILALPILGTAIANMVPRSWEAAWGDHVYAQAATLLSGSTPECRGSPGREHLERLLERLAGVAGVAGVAGTDGLHLHILHNRIPNAFVLPGRHVVVLSGLIDTAKTADEVAGVLAHEVAHVSLGHVTRLMVQDYGFKLIWLATIGAGNTGNMAQSLLGLSYSREAEREADSSGIAFLTKAGIRNDGLGQFLERVTKEQRDMPSFAAFLSSHPQASERVQSLVTSKIGQQAMSPEAWSAVKAVCKK